MDALPPLAVVLLVWLILAITFTGIGLLAQRLAGLAPRGGAALFAAFWLGWSATLLLVLVWNLLLPVNAWAYLPIALAGSAGWALSPGTFRLLGCSFRARLGFLLVAGGIAVAGAAAALGPLGEYDAGLYHLNAVRWANAHATVPGLANLHGRLGFNNSYHLYLALLNVGPLRDKAHHFAPGLLVATLLMQLVCAFFQFLLKRATPADRFRALLLVPTLATVGQFIPATTSTDLVVSVVHVIVACDLFEFLGRGETCCREEMFALFRLSAVTAACLTLKLSTAVFGVGVLGVAFGALLFRRRRRPEIIRRGSLVGVVTVAVFLAPWAARGVVLSGYPLFPSSLLPVSVDWKVPEAATRAEHEAVVGWARDPGPDYRAAARGWEWLGPWAARTSRTWLAPLLLALAAVVACSLGKRPGARPSLPAFLVMLPAGFAALAWFLTAPDPRFAGALFWIVAVGSVDSATAITRTPLRIALLSAAVLTPGVVNADELTYFAEAPVEGWAAASSSGGFPPLYVVPLREYTTDFSVRVVVPEEGDQTWDAPLVSAPEPVPDLRLRRPGDPSGGFTRTWQPQ